MLSLSTHLFSQWSIPLIFGLLSQISLYVTDVRNPLYRKAYFFIEIFVGKALYDKVLPFLSIVQSPAFVSDFQFRSGSRFNIDADLDPSSQILIRLCRHTYRRFSFKMYECRYGSRFLNTPRQAPVQKHLEKLITFIYSFLSIS
jgi:hypothetical protein